MRSALGAAISFGVGGVGGRAAPTGESPVVITEAMASNRHTLRDEDGDSTDWIELTNLSGEAISLDGWLLSDDPAWPDRWAFSGLVMPPHGRQVVFCSAKDRQADTEPTVSPRLPSEVSGLTVWFDAGTIDPRDPDVVVSRGGRHYVQRWVSRAEWPLAVEQREASLQPEWQPATVGGQPGVRFLDSISGLISRPIPGSVLSATGESTLVVVQRYQTPRHYSTTVIWQSSATNQFSLCALWGDAGFYFELGNPGLGRRLNYPAPEEFDDAWVVISATWRQERIAELHLNGRPYVSQAVRTGFDRAAQAPLRIGTYGFTGWIAELVVFNRALSPAERGAVEACLGHKYSLPRLRRQWHANFKLESGRDLVQLSTPDGGLVDRLALQPAPVDVSQGRLPDSRLVALFARPTPGTVNEGPSFSGQTPAPRLSHPSGFYPVPFALGLDGVDAPAVVRYTVDGSDPTMDSPAWRGDLAVGATLRPPDRLMWVPTNPAEHRDADGQPTMPDEQRHLFGWQPPRVSGTGPLVLSLRAFRSGYLPSAKVVATYFVGVDGFPPPSLAVAAVAFEPGDLFDAQRGLYVPGAAYVPTAWSPWTWWGTGNYFQRGFVTERPAHFTLFSSRSTAELDQDAGLRIHGGATRALPMKALGLYARKWMGHGSFEFAHLSGAPARYARLILRNSGQDSAMRPTLLRQSLAAALAGTRDATMARSRLCMLYLDGEYWGLHQLTEDYGDAYLAKWGVSADQVDYLDDGRVQAGDAAHYRDMVDFALFNSLSDEANYRRFTAQLDPEAFAEYVIAEVYTANADWPHGNLSCWRVRQPAAGLPQQGVTDGRWRWLLADLDSTFGLGGQVEDDTLATLIDGRVAGMELDVLARALLENPEFQTHFLNRFADRLNQDYAPETVLAAIQLLVDQVRPAVASHAARWGRPASEAEWETEVDRVRSFAAHRPEYLRRHLISRFRLEGDVELSLEIDPPRGGSVQLNSLRLGGGHQTGLWRGRYFRPVPLTIMALPEPGYRFAGWSGWPAGSATSDRLVLSSDVALTARFEVDADLIASFVPSPHPLRSGPWVLGGWPMEALAGTYPANTVLWQVWHKDPALGDWNGAQTPWTLAYSLGSRSRFVGLDDAGIGLVNTSSSQPMAGAGYAGALVLALDTRHVTNASLSWTAGTVTPSARPHAVRLQWRTGNSSPFRDWLRPDTSEPIEYRAPASSTNQVALGPFRLPHAALDHPYIQLRWVYYADATELEGPRPLVRLDDVVVSAVPLPVDYLVWLDRYLPPLPIVRGYSDCSPETDLDADGTANIIEYLSDSNPVRADSSPDWRLGQNSPDAPVKFFWPVHLGARGVEYGLEVSDDLRIWKATDWSDPIVYLHEGRSWRLAVSVDPRPPPGEGRSRFYRVSAGPQGP